VLAAGRNIRVLSVVDAFTRECLARIERLNPALNALVDFDAERVRAQARLAKSGPLAGLPVTVKSSIAAKGYKCEIGSALNRGCVPQEDAEVVARLRAAGATLLGTTNCPEFLMAYESDNSMYGRVNNPWDLARTAGGSSGGAAAAVAAGLARDGGAGQLTDELVGQVTEAVASGSCDVAFMPRDATRETLVEFGPAYYLIASTYLVPAGSTMTAPSVGTSPLDSDGFFGFGWRTFGSGGVGILGM